MISSKTSNDLFNKIRSKFGNIQIGNTMGEATANPGDAVFFDFDFQEEGDSFGRVSISLADGESVKVFYNQGLVEKLEEDDKTAWYAFLKELKDFAVTHQLGFDVRDITKSSLTKQDFKNIADTNQTVNTADMSEELNRIVKLSGLAESLTGTARSSFESLDKTRLIIRHSKAVDENIPGDRTRNINSLYIENSDGERFKYPVIHLAGARAMARHVANGGVPHDDFGKHIVGVSEQIAQLNSFSRYTANKDQLNDSAGDIIEKAKMKLETMRKYVKGLSKQKNYEAIKETFQPSAIAELDDATKDSLREKFTLKHMDDRVESALPLLHSIMQEFDKPEDEIADPEMDKPLSAKDAEIPAPVSAAPLVQQYLSDPENKLVLRKDDSADAMLKRTKFTTKNGMLSSILSDIASRMLTKTPDQDRVANFASQIANDIGREGTPFFDVTKDYIANKKIAFQLAKRYVDDYKKIQQDPEYASQVRQDPAEYGNPKKDRQGKAKESAEAQFESWADNIVEQKPYVSLSPHGLYSVLDMDGESAYSTNSKILAYDYLKKNFDQLAGITIEPPIEEDADQPMIIDGKEVDESTIEYDMQDYGDLIAPISDAKFIDGTDLTPEQQEELENSNWYTEWVMTDYNNSRVESAEQPVEEDTGDDALAQELAKYFQGIADGYPKDQHGDQEHEEMTSIADAFKTDGLQAGMNDINTSRFEFSSNPFDQDGSGDMDDDMMMLLKKHGVSAKMKGALAYLVKGSKAITNPEEAPQTEGNDFAQAVNKAKAAGMKPGDKFTVGDKEYTLKDAIERAGLQLETFFNEDSNDYEGSVEYEFTGDDGEMAWGKIHYKAVNGQVDPNSLQGESEYEGNAKVDDEYATYVIQPGGDEHDEALLAAQEDYDEIAMKMQSKFEQSAVQEDDDDEKHTLWGDWGTTPQEWSDTHVSNNDDIVIAIAKGQKPPQPELIDGYMDEQNDQWPENVRGGKYKTAQIVDIIGDTIGYKCRTLGYEYFSPIHDGEIDGMYKPTAEMIKDAQAIVRDPEFAKARARASGGTTSEGNDELSRMKQLSNIGNKDHAQEIPKGYHKMPDGTVMKDSETVSIKIGGNSKAANYVKEYRVSQTSRFGHKDGNKTEPMKKAVADKELSEILNLAGV
jgi:hypothetical protein